MASLGQLQARIASRNANKSKGLSASGGASWAAMRQCAKTARIVATAAEVLSGARNAKIEADARGDFRSGGFAHLAGA